MDYPTTGEALIAALVLAVRCGDYLLDKKRDGESQAQSATLETSVHGKINELEVSMVAGMTKLEGYIIGPDGKNGLRGDVSEIKDRVSGLERRELDRATDRPSSRGRSSRSSGRHND